MTKYIVDLKSLYECLQFLPRVIVDGNDMVNLDAVLEFIAKFPRIQVSETVNVILESNYEAD